MAAESEAVGLAVKVVEQLITLSTALVGLSIAFAEKIVPGDMLPRAGRRALASAWASLLASTATGIWTLMALTGSTWSGDLDLYSTNISVPAFLQVLLFLAGLAILIGAKLRYTAPPGGRT